MFLSSANFTGLKVLTLGHGWKILNLAFSSLWNVAPYVSLLPAAFLSAILGNREDGSLRDTVRSVFKGVVYIVFIRVS